MRTRDQIEIPPYWWSRRKIAIYFMQHAAMTDQENPFLHLELQQAIELRWALRDIRAKRWKLTPIDPQHLQTLIDMGLVEMRDDEAVITTSGLDIIA
jgi:hypothetical protein